ncbi:pyridoxamine 5'-phosphate oxidase family protein [Gluconobacter sphaericus]|uniref:pyridoxamine 5'-phosphate oxidase family protein n=1 Tax=Gluconobacter sphaericus TaxID=574987 RepID=UPI001B8D2574|nr:pyridoxamine 5'-phosphate oxidase family protein [Gluconobacter sphaericus]MBS1097650.1 pyridoxamine 5'-phosphate oxidase family protein [Gluconobacter sphaericus]
MTAFTSRIDALLEEYHVMSLAVCAGHQHWAAPVFYVFDPLRMRLLFVTDPSTRHGLLLEQTGRAIATVSGQDRSIPFLRGLQMEGDAWRLGTADRKLAEHLYTDRFSIPFHLQPVYWAFTPLYIKAIDNRNGFGYKEEWGHSQ